MGEKLMIRGIDLSEYQGTRVNWDKVRKAGFSFAFFKVNEGDYIDPTSTLLRVERARKAGLLVGGYNFLKPKAGRSGATEFHIFYEHAMALGLLKKGCLRPVVDVEDTTFGGWTPKNPVELSAEDRRRTRRYVYSWIHEAHRILGVHPIVYTGRWFWDDTIGAKNSQGCKLWLAAYKPQITTADVPSGFDKASFWQWTSKGRVPGIGTRLRPRDVDLNHYLSSMTDLKRGHTLPRTVA